MKTRAAGSLLSPEEHLPEKGSNNEEAQCFYLNGDNGFDFLALFEV